MTDLCFVKSFILFFIFIFLFFFFLFILYNGRGWPFFFFSFFYTYRSMHLYHFNHFTTQGVQSYLRVTVYCYLNQLESWECP